MTSHEFNHLKDFLRNEPLDKIAISRVFHELWKHSDIQSEDNDCDSLLRILEELEMENLDNGRKQCLISLQDINKFETDEPPNWKLHAVSNINRLKGNLQDANTLEHRRLLEKIRVVDINDLTYDNPLANGIVDLGSPQYQIIEDDYEVLVVSNLFLFAQKIMPIILNNIRVRELLTQGEKSGIKNLIKDPLVKGACVDFITKRDKIRDKIRNQYKFIISPSKVLSHGRWVERGVDRVQVAVNITDILLQEIKRNVLRRVSGGSENVLVDAITRLMEASLYQVPIEFDIEVTRNECQSMASKKRKTKQVIGSRGNKPDLMVRVFFKRRWNELAYLENGYVDMSKKINKNELNKFVLRSVLILQHFIVINGFLRENGIKFYLPIAKAKIPFHNASLEEVEDFVHALLVLRNGIMVNIHGISRTFLKNSPKSHDVLHVKQISESQSIPNTPNLPEESSEQNTDLQKTKIPEIDVQPLIEELRIEPLMEDTVKVVNVDKNSTDKQSLAIELSNPQKYTNTVNIETSTNLVIVTEFMGFWIWTSSINNDSGLSEFVKTTNDK
ncbi:20423_t:CDS:2 [Entrophospora sp. SA101]|nr:20423_t:CDS:2 [Entrophospora sp. SA101]